MSVFHEILRCLSAKSVLWRPKSFRFVFGPGSTSNSAREAYSALPGPLAGWEGARCSLARTTPTLRPQVQAASLRALHLSTSLHSHNASGLVKTPKGQERKYGTGFTFLIRIPLSGNPGSATVFRWNFNAICHIVSIDIGIFSDVMMLLGLVWWCIFARDSIYAVSAHMLSQFRPSVCLSVCHTGDSSKNGWS